MPAHAREGRPGRRNRAPAVLPSAPTAGGSTDRLRLGFGCPRFRAACTTADKTNTPREPLMNQLTAICLLALAPMIASASHGPHLATGAGNRTATGAGQSAIPGRDRTAFTEAAALAAGGAGLVLMGWAWRRSTRRTDSRS